MVGKETGVRAPCVHLFSSCTSPTYVGVCERYKPRQMACAFVSVFCFFGGEVDFVNVFVGICVDDISNKILHAMCVKWRPIHIIHRGSGNPREEREGS